MKGLKYIVLACNIVLFALLAVLLPLGFEENDDVMMCMIANGTYSGMPDFHLVYINVLYGFVLAGLYSLTKAVEWYTLSFAVLHILSMSVLAYCILTTPNRARWEKVLWLLILYVLWARIIIALQFTTTAGLVCLAGCMLLLRESKKARWSGVVLVIIAALIRFMAAGLVGLLMAPIIVYTYRLNWRRYIAIVVMLTAVVGCRVANHMVYDSDPEWKYFRAYNQLRAQLNDNPNAYKMTTAQLPETIDPMDYQLLLRFVPDAEQIDLPAIRQLSATVGDVPFRQQLKNLHRLDKYAVEVVILFALLILMILTTGNRSKYLFLIIYTLFVLVLIVHVSLDGFLKNRVFLCILTPMLVTDFMLLPNTTGLKRRWGIGIAMVVLSAWYGYQIYEEKQTADYNRYTWSHLQQPLLAYVPEGAYVTTIGTSMMMEATDPWHVWPYEFRKYTLGWLTWCPLNKSVGHSYRALLREDMYIFTHINYTHEHTALQRVSEQIEKHYGVPSEIVWKCRNGGYALVQLKVKP
ncbi:MAG: hypothetical protein IKS01_02435 [Paludibacteraceae bacterium]|nr:hypothetical protein [Paludibacteraceae bacterium]